MRLIKLLICFALIFNFNNKAEAVTGVGQIKLNDYTLNQFFAYLRGDGISTGEVGKKKGRPLSFAVNPEGTYSFYYYCPIKFESGACHFAGPKAVSECSKISKANGGSKCKLFARGYKVVWGGANIKFPRKFDEQMVRSVFKENGWYGDTTIKKKPKITKKKETKTKVSKNKSTVEQLKEIKKLLDEGLITDTEFKKLKKEIFN